MAKKLKITHAQLTEALHYDPETGVFTRKIRTAQSVRVGDVAGTVDKETGYVLIGLYGDQYFAHHLAVFYMLGECDLCEKIDHRDGNRANCAWSNIRLADNFQNSQNSRLRSDNSSGEKGISMTRHGTWSAEIMSRKRRIRKVFKDKRDAVNFLADIRKELHGEFANAGN